MYNYNYLCTKAKFAKVFSRERNPLYGIPIKISTIMQKVPINSHYNYIYNNNYSVIIIIILLTATDSLKIILHRLEVVQMYSRDVIGFW